MLSALAAAALAAALANPAVAQKTYTYNAFLPPQHIVVKSGLEPYLKEIEEATGGGLKWTLLTGGQLFGASAMLDGIGQRVAEAGGAMIPHYFQSELRNAFMMIEFHAFGLNEHSINAAVLQTLLLDCPQCLEDYKKLNLVPLGQYGTGAFSMLCNTRVTSLKEAAGKRHRSIGPTGRIARAAGGTPVNMTPQDMVEALARGQVECTIGPVAWLISYPIEDSVTHILEYGFGVTAGVGFMTMNREAWQELSRDQQQAILRLTPLTSSRINFAYMEENERARQRAKERGIVHTRFTQADPEIKAFLEPHQEAELKVILQNAERRRMQDPEAVAKRYLANLEAWDKRIADNPELTVEQYADMLWEHIYSKVDPAIF